MEPNALRVAIVGSGPAGAYAADALMKSGTANRLDVRIDIFERLPAPYGLIRYGVAPDHPRIKTVVTALEQVLDKPQVRLFGNVEYGIDINLDDLRGLYHAVIFATGASADRPLRIPGIDLDGSFGAADFVSWYDGHPRAPRTWPLQARQVAVIGVGNVALDVARMLAKTADELLPTEIPANVHAGFKANQAVDVHVFGRRGPAHAKFTPIELRELDHSPSIEVIVDPRDIVYDDEAERARRSSKQIDMVASTLESWAIRDVTDRRHRIYLHFFESPVEVVGADGKVVGLRTERAAGADGAGRIRTWDVQALYRAVGYLSEPVAKVPFDEDSGTVPNESGRVIDAAGTPMPAIYVTGWIKRGPVGLIGHTKGDASETVACLLADFEHGRLAAPADHSDHAILDLLGGRRVAFTTWEGWRQLDVHERALGGGQGRERVKVVDHDEMVRVSRQSSERCRVRR